MQRRQAVLKGTRAAAEVVSSGALCCLTHELVLEIDLQQRSAVARNMAAEAGVETYIDVLASEKPADDVAVAMVRGEVQRGATVLRVCTHA